MTVLMKASVAAIATLALLSVTGTVSVALPRSDDPIATLDSPACVKAPEAQYAREDDEVLGVGRNGEFCAYPLRIMSRHRVVNDHLGGPPILVAYDPTSAAGAVYDPTANGKALTFDPAEARNGVPALRDRETGSIWSLFTGEALAGPLVGRKLGRIHSLILSWRHWTFLHKESWTLKEDPKLAPVYSQRTTPAALTIPSTALPARLDRRLPADTLVLGILVNGKARAYVMSELKAGFGAVNDRMNGRRIAVLCNPAAEAAAAFDVGGVDGNSRPVLKARDAEGERVFVVSQPGPYVPWSVDGAPIFGRYIGNSVGALLAPLACTRCRWYAWSAAFPKSEIGRVPAVKASVPNTGFESFHGALVAPEGFNAGQAKRLVQEGYNSVAFDLSTESNGVADQVRVARASGLRAYGWIQVARDEKAAVEHADWLHSPQHNEWLQVTDHTIDRAVDHKVFPAAPGKARDTTGTAHKHQGRATFAGNRVSGPGDVGTSAPGRYVVFPWVCVNNRSVFDYERGRIHRILARQPVLDGLFLSDIQGAPMGCGCGNPLCRSWDNSRGDKVAAAPYDHPEVSFSRVFVDAVRKDFPGLQVLPVLCEECENGVNIGPAVNPDLDGACHGVPCVHPCSLDYYPTVLRAMSGEGPIGLLGLYRVFARTGPEYGAEAAWISGIVRRVHGVVPAQPVIAVLQGWSGSAAQRALQKQRALEGGATGYLMAMTYVNESWEARKAAE